MPFSSPSLRCLLMSVYRAVFGLVLIVILLAMAPSASAHTDLDVTSPVDGSVVDTAVEDVTLTFTKPVTQLGPGVVIVGPNGEVSVEVSPEESGLVWKATPRESLAPGEYAVAWTVAAEDGHPLTGEFTFGVEGGAEAESAATDSARATDSPAADTAGPSASPNAEDATPSPPVSTSAADPAAGASSFAEVAARLGSAASLWGALVAGGVLVFGATVLRGEDRDDLPIVVAVIRWSAALILLGLVVRVMARSILLAQGDVAAAWSFSSLGDALGQQTRIAFGLQGLGALAVMVGIRPSFRASWVAVLGVSAIGVGHVVAGHSNTVEPRWLVLVADVTHLLAAAVWVGGVVMIGVLLRYRRRRGRPLNAALMGSRFSVLAGASVALVGLAGVALTWTILDTPSQLWQSSWGLFLIAKVIVVAMVGAIGAYNHFRVVPALEAGVARGLEGHTDNHLLRRSAAHETGLMVVIVLLTAWLVGASTSV